MTRLRIKHGARRIFELKKDSSVKSMAYRDLFDNSPGSEVGALTQEPVEECKDLDEITSDEEL